MSRTKHHKGQRNNKIGLDFGGKYKHNKGYGGGYGKTAKDCAHSELRSRDKDIIKRELDEVND